MNSSFYKKVIKLIPSVDLRNYTLLNDYQFSEKDLLKIILEFSPTFNERLKLFEEASRLMCDKNMRMLAKKRLDFEKRQYAAFIQASPDTVYQIEIKTEPSAADEDSYITTTFGEAVELIKRFIRYYNIKAKELLNARYTIKKKTTTLPSKGSDFFNDKVGTIGKCILNNKFDILDLETRNSSRKEIACKKGMICDDCMRCIEETVTHFPNFLKRHDLVGYYDDLKYNPSHLTYGIFDCDIQNDDTFSLIVLIEDNRYIKTRNAEYQDENGYYRVYDAHTHQSYFTIIQPDLKDVPQNILDDYNYALKILKKIEADL